MICKFCGGRARLLENQGVLLWFECEECGEKFPLERPTGVDRVGEEEPDCEGGQAAGG